MRALVYVLVLTTFVPAHSLALTPTKFRESLSRARPLLVELYDSDPEIVSGIDLEDMSEKCRDSGATALVVQASTLPAFAKEQASAAGNFPGPLPLICDLTQVAAAEIAEAAGAVQALGAAGIMVTCAALEAVATDQITVAVASSRAETAVAAEQGATAIVCEYEAAAPEDKGSGSAAVTIASWDGSDEELSFARESGFQALLLRDGCGGSFRDGIGYTEASVLRAMSKASKQWGGSMFGSTNDDVVPPSQRNPRMWAQSQRQAREIMHESAKSRGLPPPKLKK